MTFEQWLEDHNPMLRRASRRYGGLFWEDDLYQTLLLRLWEASEKYPDQFHLVASSCIRGVIADHLRFLKRNTYLSLDPEFEAPETALEFDWHSLFRIAHHTGNLTAVRVMRSVLNPDQNQVKRERRSGGFSWRIVRETVGLSQEDIQRCLADLKRTLQGGCYEV